MITEETKTSKKKPEPNEKIYRKLYINLYTQLTDAKSNDEYSCVAADDIYKVFKFKELPPNNIIHVAKDMTKVVLCDDAVNYIINHGWDLIGVSSSNGNLPCYHFISEKK